MKNNWIKTSHSAQRTVLLFILTTLVCVAHNFCAMDKWDALSTEESGNNDNAIGPQGEVSRYQIMPDEWKRMCTGEWIQLGPGERCLLSKNNSPRKHLDAWVVAVAIMEQRENKFEARHHRPATDLEWALLWKCPSRVDHPSKEKLEQARRVVNLIEASTP